MASRDEPLTEEEVLEWFGNALREYEAGNEGWFDQFSPDASFFTPSTPTRIDGRDVWREGFAPYFLGSERVSQILSPEIRLLGPDAVLLTFHNRVLVKGMASNVRGTVVIARNEEGQLQFVHMHNSPLTQTASASVHANPDDLDKITVLEERVAAAAAMVGTPK